MTVSVAEIFSEVRYSLSDVSKTRWEDARLISLLNQAIYDVANSTDIFSKVGYLKLQTNVSVYDISHIAIKINRIENVGRVLETVSFAEMDHLFGSGWQDKTDSTPCAIVFDLKYAGEFRVYPIPENLTANLVSTTSNYGLVTGIYYEDIELELIENLGTIQEPVLEEYLKIYYVRIPAKVTSVTDILEDVIDRSMIEMFSYYIVGRALRDNEDTQNIVLANQNINLYNQSKMKLTSQKMINNFNVVRESTYRPFG